MLSVAVNKVKDLILFEAQGIKVKIKNKSVERKNWHPTQAYREMPREALDSYLSEAVLSALTGNEVT